eukprot:UN10971
MAALVSALILSFGFPHDYSFDDWEEINEDWSVDGTYACLFKKATNNTGAKNASSLVAYYYVQTTMFCNFALYLSILGIVGMEYTKINTDLSLSHKALIKNQVAAVWFWFKTHTIFMGASLT